MTHWLEIGRTIEHSGSYDHARNTAASAGRLETTALTEKEETAWFDAFTEKMGRASEEKRKTFMPNASVWDWARGRARGWARAAT